MSSEQHATSFAELPGEIRLQIYRHLLQDIGLNITIRDERLQLQEPRKTGNLLYALLSCRQVHRELTPLIYNKIPLRIATPGILLTIANTIAPSSLQQINSLSMIWPLTGLPHRSYLDLGYYHATDQEAEAMKVWRVIATMRGLRELKVELNVAGLWRKSWVGWEDVLLRYVAEAGGMTLHTVQESRDEDISGAKTPPIASLADDYCDDTEKVLTIWVPWERDASKDDRWEGKLGCKILWK